MQFPKNVEQDGLWLVKDERSEKTTLLEVKEGVLELCMPVVPCIDSDPMGPSQEKVEEPLPLPPSSSISSSSDEDMVELALSSDEEDMGPLVLSDDEEEREDDTDDDTDTDEDLIADLFAAYNEALNIKYIRKALRMKAAKVLVKPLEHSQVLQYTRNKEPELEKRRLRERKPHQKRQM